MNTVKKNEKSKFAPDNLSDLLNEYQFLNNSPKKKNPQKRQKIKNTEETIPNIIGYDATNSKKQKIHQDSEVCGESRQKILNIMSRQLESRKKINEDLQKKLNELINHLEADYKVLKENEPKIEHLTSSIMKCTQQVTAAHEQKLRTLKEIQLTYKKGAEGLIKRGAIKPDDRPIWFDVYRAFPPLTEPKYARPTPETRPIKQILYKEDVIRAQFHTKGHGLGSNMLSPYGETQTKKLLQKYEQLKKEGIPEEEVIEKTVAAVINERESETPKTKPVHPESVTAQILSEVNIKNIFKE